MTHSNELSPPEWLAALAGGDSSFSEVGREFADHLVELCALEPSGSVLDVGCGAGRIAVALTSYLSGDGRYDGFDVLPWAIEWCQKEVTSRFPNFTFQLADVFSEQYYPDGRLRPEEYTFPVADGSCDVACALVRLHAPAARRGRSLPVRDFTCAQTRRPRAHDVLPAERQSHVRRSMPVRSAMNSDSGTPSGPR